MTDATAGTLADLIADMHAKRSVLRGWDAALSLSETAINDVLANGWPASGGRPGQVVWHEALTGAPESGALVQVDFNLGPPVLALGEGAAVSIRLDILAAGIRRGITDKAPSDLDAVNWSSPVPLTVVPAARLAGTANLVLAPDPDAKGRHSLFLDTSGQDWTIEGGAAPALDTATLAQKLRDWLAPDQTRLVIASVDFDTDQGEARLIPSSVRLNRPPTGSGPGIVQLLIATHGSPPADGGIDVADPIPAADGASYSLMIGSGVVIPEIVDKYNLGTGLVKLDAIPPDANGTAWFAQTRNPMRYSGSISANGAFPTIESQAELHMRFAGSKDEGLALSTYVAPTSNIQPQLVLSGTYPIGVTGSKIALGANPASVQATGVAENAVKPRLEEFLNRDIATDMSAITLDSVSAFALGTIGLPGSLLGLHHVAMPGDLLITGTVLRADASGQASD